MNIILQDNLIDNRMVVSGTCIDGVGKFNFVPFSTNATKLDRESVRTPGTQQGCVGKFSVVVLI